MSAEPITYHLIPHTHWDREWYLSFDHFRVMLVHMLDDLLDILASRDDYAGFLLDGQTIVAEDYLEVRPERRREIEEYVRQGRLWMGPWYVLPDTFLVSGESLVRNLMLGRRQARSFGSAVDVGYIPDSFGHTAQIPQILRGFSIRTGIVWRGFGGERGQEGSEFRWTAPDGSELLMEHLSDYGYSGAYFGAPDVDVWQERFREFRRRIDSRARTPERLVLSGGDHHWPVEHLPDVVQKLNESLNGHGRVEHSSLSNFMARLEHAAEDVELPVVEGELRFGYRWAFNLTGGVYSSRMYLKQANARCQRLLERYLEPMDVLSVLSGGRSQRSIIDYGWKYLLQNNPHDSICGCSIDPVHREMMVRYEKLEELGVGVERFTWMTIGRDDEGEAGDDHTLALFNPSAFPRDEVIECDIQFFRQQVVVGLNLDVTPDPPLPAVDGFVIEDFNGGSVPFEIIERGEDYALGLNRYDYPAQSRVERFRVRLPQHHLPPLGVRMLRVRRTDAFAHYDDGAVRSGERYIENDFVRVDVLASGAFEVTDLQGGVRYGPMGHFEDAGDAGDEYNYSPPPEDRICSSVDAEDVVIDVKRGLFAASIAVSGTWRLPQSLTDDLGARSKKTARVPFTTTASLTEFSRFVAFETTLDNQVRDHRLRVLFETGRKTNRHLADNAFAVLEREQKQYNPHEFDIEVPTAVAPVHRFVTVEDDEAGATVVVDGLPEYELKHDSGGVLAVTLLRCVGELARPGLLTRPGGQSGWRNLTPDAQCQGRHRFRYAFLPHGRDWSAQMELINETAESFLLHPRTTTRRTEVTAHEDRSLLAIQPRSLVLSACKEAQDGQDIIVRIYNPTDRPVAGNIIFGTPPEAVHRANLEEDRDLRLHLEGATLRDTWPPFAIHTYRLIFPPGRNRGDRRSFSTQIDTEV